MTAPAPDWCPVAQVGKPHGLRGAVYIKPLLHSPEEFLELPHERYFAIARGRVQRELRITHRALHKGLALLFFEDIDDRTAAEELVGLQLAIPADERPPHDEDSFYVDEVEGMEVHDLDADRSLGPVLRILDGPGSGLLVIRHPDRHGHEVMIPMVAAFVDRIDRPTRRVLVHLPDGLLDLE
jgi:16S rRNA processing protein RimM